MLVMNLLSPNDPIVSDQFNSREGFREARVTVPDLRPDSHYIIELYEIYSFSNTFGELRADSLHLGKKILTLTKTHGTALL